MLRNNTVPCGITQLCQCAISPTCRRTVERTASFFTQHPSARRASAGPSCSRRPSSRRQQTARPSRSACCARGCCLASRQVTPAGRGLDGVPGRAHRRGSAAATCARLRWPGTPASAVAVRTPHLQGTQPAVLPTALPAPAVCLSICMLAAGGRGAGPAGGLPRGDVHSGPRHPGRCLQGGGVAGRGAVWLPLLTGRPQIRRPATSLCACASPVDTFPPGPPCAVPGVCRGGGAVHQVAGSAQGGRRRRPAQRAVHRGQRGAAGRAGGHLPGGPRGGAGSRAASWQPPARHCTWAGQHTGGGLTVLRGALTLQAPLTCCRQCCRAWRAARLLPAAHLPVLPSLSPQLSAPLVPLRPDRQLGWSPSSSRSCSSTATTTRPPLRPRRSVSSPAAWRTCGKRCRRLAPLWAGLGVHAWRMRGSVLVPPCKKLYGLPDCLNRPPAPTLSSLPTCCLCCDMSAPRPSLPAVTGAERPAGGLPAQAPDDHPGRRLRGPTCHAG